MPNAPYLLFALALGVAISWGYARWLRHRAFVWRIESITAEIHALPNALNRRYLNLEQTLRPGESGWTNMKVEIPESWVVRSIGFTGSRVVVSLYDGSEYYLGRRNIGSLSFEILNGGHKSEADLAGIWTRYGRAKSA